MSALLGLSLILPVFGVAAKDKPLAGQRVLEAINFSSLPGNKVQIMLTMSGEKPPAQPMSFTIDNPARIALDFPETASNVAKKQAIGVGVATSLSIAEAKGRTRVVINLVRLVPYETRVEDDKVYIVLDSETADVAALPPAAQAEETGVATAKGQALTTNDVPKVQHAITNIDFRRGKKGEGSVIVTLSDPSIPVNIREEGGKIVVDFIDTRIAESMVQRLDVIDFATPVTYVDSVIDDGNVQIIITAEGEYEHLAYQSNQVLTLEIKPVSKEEQEAFKKEKFGYTGERLSLNFQDIEIRAVLQLIADFTGLNMVTSDTIKGNVTLRLQNVPWDQALDIILKTKGLDMRKDGNVILVAPGEEIAAREKQEFESFKQKEELAPLRSDLVQVNYAKAEDMAALLKAKENSIMSERGSVTIDTRTNTLLLNETAEKLEDIRRLISKLDIPVRQVLIESRIVIANDDFSRDLGVRFGASGVKEHDTTGIIGSSGSLAGTDSMVSDAPVPVSMPLLNDRLNVSLPIDNAAGRIAFAVLGSDYLVDLELSAMQAEGRGEVVSSPRVITSNQSEAFIEQGVEIPYLEASSSGAATVSFKKAVLSLRVTPQITPDDRVIMDLAVNKDSVGEIFQNVPSVDTREVNTQVLIDNGETVVLGGIYEQSRSNEVDAVPMLGDLPFVGALFRTTRKVDDKAELLIFVTPKILKESLGLR
ncbi:MAG TPA: type IV pilus secretin PilQ [Gammaproteobacteria bacterium]